MHEHVYTDPQGAKDEHPQAPPATETALSDKYGFIQCKAVHTWQTDLSCFPVKFHDWQSNGKV